MVLQWCQSLAEPVEKLVNEVKYVGTERHTEMVSALLAAACQPDGEYPVGAINSIYFDTPNRQFHDEKLNGDNLKLKVRLRWYGRPGPLTDEDVPAFIEAKHRLGSARRKTRIAVRAPARWLATVPLDDPGLVDFLYRHAAELGEAIPHILSPSVCISYSRQRYICPVTGSRVAVDWQIRAGRVNPARFPTVGPVHLDRIVVEFKNQTKELPAWSYPLFQMGLRLRSFSKYGECMNQVLQGGAPL